MSDTIGSATYSPEDNKLRIYPDARLEKPVYERVRAAGYKWAPKQELFVAPMWTPDREDLAVELCGEVGDEDTSLVDRAEERAERFEDYSANRAKDAEATKRQVDSICDGIPMGQPILVGHHSERRARRDAEKIENGMRKSIKLWDQSQYWTQRAAGALRHAKYLERPDVRARRIRKIEADKRKQERAVAEHAFCLRFWTGKLKIKNRETGESRPLEITEDNREMVVKVIGRDSRLGYLPICKHPTLNQNWSACDVLRPDGERYGECPAKTVAECQAVALKFYPRLDDWCNRWISHYNNRLAYERAMMEESGGTQADKTKPQKGGACRSLWSPRGGWAYIQKVNQISVSVLHTWNPGGRLFRKTVPFDKLYEIMTPEQVQEARDVGRLIEVADKTGFVLCDPKPETKPEPTPKPEPNPKKAEVDAMRETLKAGVQTVTAPQLFPTPKGLAERMATLLDIQPGNRVLEPSAGTGALLGACGGRMFEEPGDRPYREREQVVAVEINRELATRLEVEFPLTAVHCCDFLECNGGLGQFDRILMNPPFANGVDIQHIKHALTFLRSGGRLVALCANGPRQQDALKPICDSWEDLPEGSFKAQGTGVRVALVVFSKEQEQDPTTEGLELWQK